MVKNIIVLMYLCSFIAVRAQYVSQKESQSETGRTLTEFVGDKKVLQQQYFPVRDRLEVTSLDGTWNFLLDGVLHHLKILTLTAMASNLLNNQII